MDKITLFVNLYQNVGTEIINLDDSYSKKILNTLYSQLTNQTNISIIDSKTVLKNKKTTNQKIIIVHTNNTDDIKAKFVKWYKFNNKVLKQKVIQYEINSKPYEENI